MVRDFARVSAVTSGRALTYHDLVIAHARRHRLCRILGGFAIGVSVMMVVVVVAFLVSPVPSIMVFSQAFRDGHPTLPKGFASIRRQVSVIHDLEYPSMSKRNTFDLYTPNHRASQDDLPVIVWVHGGGFIAGDKSGVGTYATLLAARGYAVVSMNYNYAPDGRYPTPVIQVGEMITHLYSIADDEHLDVDDISIGGDSAGAQIAAQFAAVQTTPGYARSSGIPRIDMSSPIASLLLFCGPYDLKSFADIPDTAPLMQRWFINTVGWGYLGKRDWRSSEQTAYASIVDHVSADFPRSYVVDGNYYSFPEQGRRLVSRLKALHVPVESSFFPEDKDLPHEFQFDFQYRQSQEVWEHTVRFLAEAS